MGEFIKVPIEEATTPRNGYECICNRWWLIEDNCVLGFKIHNPKDWPSPQCNTNRLIVERGLKRNSGQEVKFMAVVYWPIPRG